MDKCGTYDGYNLHKYLGETVCDNCRQAAIEYHRSWRAANPAKTAAEAIRNAARHRALWRLARIHPGEFDALTQDELSRLEANRCHG